MRASLDELRAALAALPMPGPARQAINDDVTRLREELHQPHVEPARVQSVFATLATHLAAAGVLVTNVASVLEPIKKIAAFLNLSLTSLGW